MPGIEVVRRWQAWLPTGVALGATALFLALLAAEWLEVLPRWTEIPWAADYDTYMSAARRWLDGSYLYPPYQTSGPYSVNIAAPVLYPPIAFVLFAPFVFLPTVLWWLIPVATCVGVVAHLRPRVIAWPAMAAGLWFPSTSHMLVTGNPGLWSVTALALGTVWGWPSVGVLVKPSLAPFALLGIRRRAWWMALAAAIAISIPMLPLWVDYARVVLNARSTNGVFYSIDQVPTMLIFVAAWLARTSPRNRQHRDVDGGVPGGSDSTSD